MRRPNVCTATWGKSASRHEADKLLTQERTSENLRFGLARTLDGFESKNNGRKFSTDALTLINSQSGGLIAGTPLYMAPEQIPVRQKLTTAQIFSRSA